MAILVLQWSGAVFACDVNRPLEARKFVEQLTTTAGNILKKTPKPFLPLKAHILARVEFEPLARHAMGRFWHLATVEQRAQYKILFRETISHALARQVLRFRDAELNFSRQSVSGAKTVLLESTLVTPGSPVTRLGWRIAFKDCRPYLADIVRDGVSLITVKRQEYRSIISRNGIDGLLTGLRRIALSQIQETEGDHEQRAHAILNQLLLDAAQSGQQVR